MIYTVMALAIWLVGGVVLLGGGALLAYVAILHPGYALALFGLIIALLFLAGLTTYGRP